MTEKGTRMTGDIRENLFNPRHPRSFLPVKEREGNTDHTDQKDLC
jgi:hypothetical protein